MKRKKKKTWIHIILRVTILVLLLVTAGCISYYTVMLYWQPKEKNEKTAYEETHNEKVTAVDPDKISKNLIFSYNSEDKELEGVVLEILNCDNGNITYLTLPLNTRFTLSAKLYQKMVLFNPELPQMMKLSALSEYFNFGQSAKDALSVVEGLLSTDINYYTVIPSDMFKAMFQEKSVKQNEGNGSVSKYTFKWDYQKSVTGLKSEDEIKEYLATNYTNIESNLKLKDKQSLSKYLVKIKSSNLHFEVLDGMNLNSGYIIDEDNVHQQVIKLSGL